MISRFWGLVGFLPFQFNMMQAGQTGLEMTKLYRSGEQSCVWIVRMSTTGTDISKKTQLPLTSCDSHTHTRVCEMVCVSQPVLKITTYWKTIGFRAGRKRKEGIITKQTDKCVPIDQSFPREICDLSFFFGWKQTLCELESSTQAAWGALPVRNQANVYTTLK